MFRLIRLVFLLTLTFVAGFLYAEFGHSERCMAKGGEPKGGICWGSQND
jgi:hypothetical protein